MLDRFLLLFTCVKRALTTLGHASKLESIDKSALEQLVHALKPIKMSVIELSKNKSDILTADIIIETLLKKLDSLNSDIGEKLYHSVKKRVEERRLVHLASLARYLNDPKNYLQIRSMSILKYSTKTQVCETAISLLTRLYEVNEENDQDAPSDEQSFSVDDSVLATSATDDFQAELQAAITTTIVEKEKVEPEMTGKGIKRDLQLFETTGDKTVNIIRLKNIVSSIKATSTEVERTFSIAGKFLSKIRANLSNVAVNALVFLKYYFIRNNQ